MGGLQVARRFFAIAALVLLLGLAGCAGAGGGGWVGGAGGAGDVGGTGGAIGNGGAESHAGSLGAQDSHALEQLAEIAARDAQTNGPVTATECWAPSQNLLESDSDPQGFRVICRVHFEEKDAQRYRDMICVGNLNRDPVAEYCYQWAYYSEAPKFEDRPAYAATPSH